MFARWVPNAFFFFSFLYKLKKNHFDFIYVCCAHVFNCVCAEAGEGRGIPWR